MGSSSQLCSFSPCDNKKSQHTTQYTTHHMEKVPTVAVAAPNPVSSSAGGVGEVGNVPRWVIAAAVGVPVAAALAYILFGPSSDSEGKNSKKKKKKADLKRAIELFDK